METLTQATLPRGRPPAQAAFPNRLSRHGPLQTIPSLNMAKNRLAAEFHPGAAAAAKQCRDGAWDNPSPKVFVKGQPWSWVQ